VPAHPITAAELDRGARKQHEGLRRHGERPEADDGSRSPRHKITEGDWRLFFIRRDRWRNLTPADVTRAAGEWSETSNLTIGMFLPEA
jgi:zinc protease